MSVQKWGVTHHISVFSVFSACDTEKTEKTGVFMPLCGFFATRPRAWLPEKETPPWGDMAATSGAESGGVTLDSNYIIPQKPYCNAIRCENANASG